MSGDQKKHFIRSFPALSNQLHLSCELDVLHYKCLNYHPSIPLSMHPVSRSSFPPSLHQLFPFPAAPQSLSSPSQWPGPSSLPGSHVALLPLPCALFHTISLLTAVPTMPLCFSGYQLGQPHGAVVPRCPPLLPHAESCLPCITPLSIPACWPPHLMLLPQQHFPGLVKALLHPSVNTPPLCMLVLHPRQEQLCGDEQPQKGLPVGWRMTAFHSHVCRADGSVLLPLELCFTLQGSGLDRSKYVSALLASMAERGLGLPLPDTLSTSPHSPSFIPIFPLQDANFSSLWCSAFAP